MLEAVIAYVSGMVIHIGTSFIMKPTKGMRMTNEEIISVSLMVAVAIMLYLR